ncbi:MAG: DUF262 domain-containing protein [Saprospiraceae bacterium]|nr:DUF262 domain-containing protein [Saprospiraceae bacterium]
MAYETPITIKKVIENIQKRHYVLPSIQREFVWDTEQIEKLFDSLMRDYPISTFLFWKVEKHRIKDFQFYEFLAHYHEKNARHNTKVNLGSDQDIIAILDGQQRMTSMFVALTGSYASKMPYYRWESPHAFPKKHLYLNLLGNSEEMEMEYDFQFLTDEKLTEESDKFWFKAHKVLEFTELPKVMEYLMMNDLMDTSKYTKEQSSFALNTLNQFFNVVHQKGSVSYFLEEGEELDKVLQIFIRINSGGTKLSYSDLLLSIATAQWQERDAREVIHGFVDNLNQIGDGFNFNKDFVLKSCLVLSDLKDVKFKVDNFTTENMEIIEGNWEEISHALRNAAILISKFGYNRDNLLANTSVIPIAYFLYKNEFGESFIHSSSQTENRNKIREWLARVSLKGTFGGTPDAIYPVMRNLINTYKGEFPLQQIIEYYRGKRRSISFSDEDIYSILELKYGKAKTYCALSLLYPSLNHSFKYHQDHIHPRSFFTRNKLRSLGIEDSEQQDVFLDRYDKIANLQLLQANENIEKKDKNFKDWLYERLPNASDQNSFLIQHYIEPSGSLELAEFQDFYERRRNRMKVELELILGVKEDLEV